MIPPGIHTAGRGLGNAEILILDLVNFIDGIVFQTFFLYPCRYCADFWHVSQSPAFLKAMHTKTDTFLIL